MDDEERTSPSERRMLEVAEWEQRPVSVTALSMEPAEGILQRVGERGAILQVPEAQEGFVAGLYFFPWSSVIHIRLLE